MPFLSRVRLLVASALPRPTGWICSGRPSTLALQPNPVSVRTVFECRHGHRALGGAAPSTFHDFAPLLGGSPPGDAWHRRGGGLVHTHGDAAPRDAHARPALALGQSGAPVT